MCKVYIVRHGRVDFRWRSWCNSEEFDSDGQEYDRSPLTNDKYSIPGLADGKIYISTLPRTKDTALMLFGQKEFIVSELIHEVPLRSGFDTKLKLPRWFWYVLGRLQWYMNNSRQPETRKYSRERAGRFIELICNDDIDCTVVTHGFFMHTLLSELKKAGFSVPKTHAKYRNGECIVAVRM